MAYQLFFSLRRFIPFIGYHHILTMVSLVAIIHTSVLLAGCSTAGHGVSGLYILSLSYKTGTASNTSDISSNSSTNMSTTSDLEVQGGYFGICTKLGESDWICRRGSQDSRFDVDSDPLNLYGYMAHFSNGVIFSGLLIASVALTLIAIGGMFTFPGWSKEYTEEVSVVDLKPFPSRLVSQVCAGSIFVASLLTLVGALWQHVAAVSAASLAQYAFGDIVETWIGAAAAGLAWTAFALTILVLLGLVIMTISIQILDNLTDE